MPLAAPRSHLATPAPLAIDAQGQLLTALEQDVARLRLEVQQLAARVDRAQPLRSRWRALVAWWRAPR